MDQDLLEIMDIEKKLINEYREIAKKAAQSNIKSFVDAFLNANLGIVDVIRTNGTLLEDYEVIEETSPIHATEHLLENNADASSLSSVLLFVSKAEGVSTTHISKIVNSMDKPPAFLQELKEEKMKLASKADRLYHDLVETKLS